MDMHFEVFSFGERNKLIENSHIINENQKNNNNIKNNNKILLANNLLEKLKENMIVNNNNNNSELTVMNDIIYNNNNNNSFLYNNNNAIINDKLLSTISPNQIILNGSIISTAFSDDTIRKQLEYDKFMNEIWIGIVITLIVISMVFCICSCFLYHQFRQWKLNYQQNIDQNQNQDDVESVKLSFDDDDPVPEYTLVSGLPSYEAALNMLKKAPPNSRIIVYPTVFSIFSKNEKDDSPSSSCCNTTSNINNIRKCSIEKDSHHYVSIPIADELPQYSSQISVVIDVEKPLSVVEIDNDDDDNGPSCNEALLK